ncbi:hypothetical protein RFI_14155 [Reticulomyxa filosa]|uniref:RRM domain-containing protein n=1 Tax=Reticulomyxa filosa TaxID=46433 RepID=X6N9R2_RETFI|nr:hypothetical protein RFI_14155 [Reticulomyxa filosa]|eukprot:ETO23030.1 hypothetical protein RFI_14155 [Reticulomyxa filosa]
MAKNTNQTQLPAEDWKSDKRQQILEESTTNLLINYIPPEMNEGTLAALFSPFGTMQNIKIVCSQSTASNERLNVCLCTATHYKLIHVHKKKGYIIGKKKLKVAYARPQSKDIQNSNLYVTNVPTDWNNDRLAQVFKPFGVVVESRILLDANGSSKGVGFVRMDTHLNALKAARNTTAYTLDDGKELIVQVFCIVAYILLHLLSSCSEKKLRSFLLSSCCLMQLVQKRQPYRWKVSIRENMDNQGFYPRKVERRSERVPGDEVDTFNANSFAVQS